MLYKIAITPDVFDYDSIYSLDREIEFLWDYLSDNCLLFLPENGNWAKYILYKNMSQITRDSILCHLKRLHDLNRIITTNIPLVNGDWLRWALEVFSECDLHSIITSKSTRIKANISGAQFIDFPLTPTQYKLAEIKDGKSRDVITSEEELRKNLLPLLEYARVIRVIDPYINFRSPYYIKFIDYQTLFGSRVKETGMSNSSLRR